MSAQSAPEVARQLGVSSQRVRAMLQAGRIPGYKVGRSWVIEADASQIRPRSRGRPVSAANAWALLALLAGEDPNWIAPSVRSRLRRRLRDGAWLLGALLGSEARSQVSRWRVLPGDLAELADKVRAVPTGLSAKLEALDVVPAGQELDLYVDRKAVQDIDRNLRPERAPRNPNLILRVPSHPWILEGFDRAPGPVVAADLLSSEEPRVAHAARRLLLSVVRDRDS